MKMNRIQFQKGLSFDEFLKSYGGEENCHVALERARWPHGFICPECGCKEYYLVWHKRVRTYQCTGCRCQTTITSGTIFHATKLPLTKWFQAMYLMTQSKNSVSALELMRILGVCYRTAWRLKHKLIQVMCERESNRTLSGRIEADDAYLGGENTEGKRGRGSENKVPFIAGVQTNIKGHPVYAVLSQVKAFNSEVVENWAQENIDPESIVVTDGLACFNSVVNAGCIHDAKIVGKGKKSTDMPCFKWVNTILSNLKTSITGTYHMFNFKKYAYRYLAEVQYRFNRRFDLRKMLDRLIFAGAQTGARPERWLRLAEARR
jgi:transposase-like protein